MAGNTCYHLGEYIYLDLRFKPLADRENYRYHPRSRKFSLSRRVPHLDLMLKPLRAALEWRSRGGVGVLGASDGDLGPWVDRRWIGVRKGMK